MTHFKQHFLCESSTAPLYTCTSPPASRYCNCSHLYAPTRLPTDSSRIRTIRFIFTTKMPTVSGDREEYTYPVLYDLVQIWSWILTWPKHSPNLIFILGASADEINKGVAPCYGNRGAKKNRSAYTFRYPGLSRSLSKLGVTFSFSKSCKASQKGQEYHCYYITMKTVYMQEFRNSNKSHSLIHFIIQDTLNWHIDTNPSVSGKWEAASPQRTF